MNAGLDRSRSSPLDVAGLNPNAFSGQRRTGADALDDRQHLRHIFMDPAGAAFTIEITTGGFSNRLAGDKAEKRHAVSLQCKLHAVGLNCHDDAFSCRRSCKLGAWAGARKVLA